MQPQLLQLLIRELSERLHLWVCIVGQPYYTSTNRRHRGRSTTPRNQQQENFVINGSFSLSGSELRELVGNKHPSLRTRLMVRKDLLQEGWLEISCKNISPAQFIMTIFRPFFLISWIILIMHIKEEPYEVKISSMRLEIDLYDQNYILYNIGIIHISNGEHTKVLEYYSRALERNPFLPQAFNNMV
ncbi:hypothetical protein ES288_D01G122500v1 [Gossypium darwinii]|uniref:Uncharacterized protein n=1 Tax=Gossypium darwinii TaxID=34276 RepID=A0A5D2DPG0_GOSDA|nr:hypothetical protein ES288_D01G122500v1 [Gossypium darwinii]